MKKRLIVILSVLLLAVLVAVLLFTHAPIDNGKTKPPVYVGVAFGGNTVDEAKAMIDRTKNYTNLFILQSAPITKNQTATTEVCDYAAVTNILMRSNDYGTISLRAK
jgi:hypothetical protein